MQPTNNRSKSGDARKKKAHMRGVGKPAPTERKTAMKLIEKVLTWLNKQTLQISINAKGVISAKASGVVACVLVISFLILVVTLALLHR